MSFVVGIDIGGSTTKIVGLKNGQILSPIKVKAGDPVTSAYGAFGRFLMENQLDIANIEKVMCTGVGSSFLREKMYGLETEMVDEFMAIGSGGKYLSGVDKAVIVSMGTGTAFVSVDGGEIEHIGGSGVGGGTLLGLSDKMFNVRSFEHVVDLAEKGDLAHVDLTIGDITRNNMSNMGDDITASNFGKLSDLATSADMALGVINLVFQTIGMFAVFAGRAKNISDIVLTGNLSTISVAKPVYTALENLHNVRFIVPQHSEFATAIGAAICGE